MPTVRLSLPHKLGADEAKSRISKMFADAKTRFGSAVTNAEEEWNGYHGTVRFTAMGFPVSSRLRVEPAEVHLEIDLPFAALPFKARMQQEIEARAGALLSEPNPPPK